MVSAETITNDKEIIPISYNPSITTRETNCPFLCRVVLKKNSFHALNELLVASAKPICLHSWQNTTLREISHLLALSNPDAANPDYKLIFRAVFQDALKNKRSGSRELGTVYVGKRSSDDKKTLHELNFRVGDFIDVCMLKATDDPPRNTANVKNDDRRNERDSRRDERERVGRNNRHEPYSRSVRRR